MLFPSCHDCQHVEVLDADYESEYGYYIVQYGCKVKGSKVIEDTGDEAFNCPLYAYCPIEHRY